jgi:lipopolysaccharide/colanic/teichoic acid biosynthesis glycosyltransferase
MSATGERYIHGRSKRALDIVGASAIGFGCAPAVVGGAALSMLDTRSFDPFFRQNRVDRDGKVIEIVKFRTIPRHLSDGPIQLHGTNDPRTSPIGNMLRHTGVDEMPQLASVVAGKLTLVGIRPLLQENLDVYEEEAPGIFEDWMPYYESTKKGLIGPNQLTRRGMEVNGFSLTPEQQMKEDIAYIESATLGQDLAILKSTPVQLLMAGVKSVALAA